MRRCAEAGNEFGFSLAESFEAVTVAAHALLEEIGREASVLEALEVALQLAFDAGDLGAGRSKLLFQFGPFAFGRCGEVGERLLDEAPSRYSSASWVSTAPSSRSLGSRSPLHLAGPQWWQRTNPESRKSVGLPRRSDTSWLRCPRISCAVSKVSSSTIGSCRPGCVSAFQRIGPR